MEKKGKVFVIDEEAEFLSQLKQALEKELLEVHTATGKIEAKEGMISIAPDLVLLGTLGSGKDAAGLHKWMKQIGVLRNIPLIVVDAPLEKRLSSGWSIDEGLQMDAVEYLTKPVDPVLLARGITSLITGGRKRIKVLIVDDHAVVRDGICALLSLQKDILVAGEAVDGKEAIEKVKELAPEVVLMDIVMPVMNGLEATRQICREFPQAKVVMLTQYADEENVVTSEQFGAVGFISKSIASSQLLEGIRSVSRGERLKKLS